MLTVPTWQSARQPAAMKRPATAAPSSIITATAAGSAPCRISPPQTAGTSYQAALSGCRAAISQAKAGYGLRTAQRQDTALPRPFHPPVPSPKQLLHHDAAQLMMPGSSVARRPPPHPTATHTSGTINSCTVRCTAGFRLAHCADKASTRIPPVLM